MKTSLKQRLLALLMSALLLVSFCGAAALAEAEIPSPGVGDEDCTHPEELREDMFRRFSKRDPNSDGSGLGLAIVQSLTELQGGSLQLAIDGDLFKVRLTFPLYTPADAAQAASSGKETP